MTPGHGTQTPGHGDAFPWWTRLPAGRVVRLDGPGTPLVGLSLEPLPDTAPAVVRYRPAAATSVEEYVGRLLDELERAAIALFPEWLPGARDIAGPQGQGVAAVRALALDLAAQSHHFGPFIADLAEAALRGHGASTPSWALEVRAAGLARVIAASYARPRAALLVEVPEALTAEAEQRLVAAAEWVAHHGAFSVWLTGASLRAVDRVAAVTVQLSEHLVRVARDTAMAGGGSWPADAGHDPPPLRYPPPAGRPHPASRAEQALEAALAGQAWAAGRAWNQTYQSHMLATAFRLDLLWAAHRCVVEIDGPEHCRMEQYAADRRRDVQLLLDGYAVVRFTNASVLDDLQTVVSQIRRLIRARH